MIINMLLYTKKLPLILLKTFVSRNWHLLNVSVTEKRYRKKTPFSTKKNIHVYNLLYAASLKLLRKHRRKHP